MLEVHLENIPEELVISLEGEFKKLHLQYLLGNWEPSQLDAGRFCEAVLRLVEYKNVGSYTPIGQRLNRQSIVGSARQNTILEDSLRLKITSLAELIMDFRNRRDVAHLGSIKVNCMDATLVVHATNWIMAELIRLETNVDFNTAQRLINEIVEKKVPLIEEFDDGRLKLLDNKATNRIQLLALCYKKYPTKVTDEDLFSWVTEKNKSRFKTLLRKLDREKMIDYHKGYVCLTRKGITWIETNIDWEINVP